MHLPRNTGTFSAEEYKVAFGFSSYGKLMSRVWNTAKDAAKRSAGTGKRL
jgi:hypothetical protein